MLTLQAVGVGLTDRLKPMMSVFFYLVVSILLCEVSSHLPNDDGFVSPDMEPPCHKQRSKRRAVDNFITAADDDVSSSGWMGSLQLKWGGEEGWLHICGCVLHKENYVITAADCIDRYWGDNPNKGKRGNQLRVVLGLKNIDEPCEGDCQILTVATATKHEDYDPEATIGKAELRNIAVLRTNENADLSGDAVQTIEITSVSSYYSICYIYGWGVTAKDGDPVTTLQRGKVYTYPESLCQTYWQIMVNKDKHMKTFASDLCTMSLQDGKTHPCYGDSGGPIVRTSGGTSYLVGIISWGHATCTGCLPSVHTRVAETSILDFITENTTTE